MLIFHLKKKESQYLNLIKNFLIIKLIISRSLSVREILMIGYGENIPFMSPLIMKERLIGFGVLRKSFLQINSIFCLRTLNQKES